MVVTGVMVVVGVVIVDVSVGNCALVSPALRVPPVPTNELKLGVLTNDFVEAVGADTSVAMDVVVAKSSASDVGVDRAVVAVGVKDLVSRNTPVGFSPPRLEVRSVVDGTQRAVSVFGRGVGDTRSPLPLLITIWMHDMGISPSHCL